MVNFKTTKHFRNKRNHYIDRSQWQITENIHAPIITARLEQIKKVLDKLYEDNALGATRNERDTPFRISEYTSTISANLRTN